MPSIQKKKEYKSSSRKLAKFFEKSRDQWKAKCKESKTKVKYLNNRVRDLERSRQKWKQKAKELETELKKLKAELETKDKQLNRLQVELEASRHKNEATVKLYQKIEAKKAIFSHFPRGHQYSLGQIMWFISFVFEAATTFRASSQIMQIISSYWPWRLKVPSWFTGRLWVLRLGYYKLTRAKEKAQDWIWIVDHTVQIGNLKCLLIVGIRQSNLPARGNSLTHQDLEPIALLPVTKSNGQIVYQQLKNAVVITGVPRTIVADHGPDLKSGISQFCQEYKQTGFIYDIKHKTASILKQVLKNDADWISFVKLASQTKNRIQQTSLAALAPPNQRTKARYMNVDILINWGSNILTFLDKQVIQPSAEFDEQKVIEKLAWVASFRKQLKQWQGLLKLLKSSENFIRKEGLYCNCELDLQALIEPVAKTKRQQMVSRELIAFVKEEAAACKANERLLGSSEVIESVFGKLKRLEQDQAKSGFTSLLLSVPAMLSTVTPDVVQAALETVSNKELRLWQKNVLGKSVQAKRREAFAQSVNTESKLRPLRTSLTTFSKNRKLAVEIKSKLLPGS